MSAADILFALYGGLAFVAGGLTWYLVSSFYNEVLK